jgi:hypothetical protein
MQGYPAVKLLDGNGNAMATVETQGGGLAFESVAVTDVSLTRGQTAYFNLGFSDVPVGSETSCPTAAALQIISTGDAQPSEVPVVGLDACGGGAVNVSAVFASTDSAATETTAPRH